MNAYLLEMMARENMVELERRIERRALEQEARRARPASRRALGRRLALGAGEALIGLGARLKALGQAGYHGEQTPAYT